MPLIILSLLLGFSSMSLAASSGGHAIGFGYGMGGPSQGDLNTVIDETNTAEGKSIHKLGTSYEFDAFYQYRFSGSMFALQVRPSYFYQGSTGSGYDVILSGLTAFSILRLYAYENNFLHLFVHGGVGYGRLSGEVTGSSSVRFAGAGYGTMVGLGSEFCFTDSHCLDLEGNMRFLPIEKNTVTSTSGTHNGFDTPVAGEELMNNNKAVGTTMTGFTATIHYQLRF